MPRPLTVIARLAPRQPALQRLGVGWRIKSGNDEGGEAQQECQPAERLTLPAAPPRHAGAGRHPRLSYGATMKIVDGGPAAAMTGLHGQCVIVSAGWYNCSIWGVTNPHRHGLRRQAIHVFSEISTASRGWQVCTRDDAERPGLHTKRCGYCYAPRYRVGERTACCSAMPAGGTVASSTPAAPDAPPRRRSPRTAGAGRTASTSIPGGTERRRTRDGSGTQ